MFDPALIDLFNRIASLSEHHQGWVRQWVDICEIYESRGIMGNPCDEESQDEPDPNPRDFIPMTAYTDDMWQTCLDYFDHKCAYCGAKEGLLRGFSFVREHFIPVSSSDCPGATPDNIVVACLSCNSQKNAHDPESWLVSRFGERKATRILNRIERYFDSVRAARRPEATER